MLAAYQAGVLAGLIQEVHQLGAELDELREELAAEVRTRRLVVVNDDGYESATCTASRRRRDG